MPTKILHLSDLHVGKTEKDDANLVRIVESVNKNEELQTNKPVIVITGDIVDDGEKEQFIRAKAILAPLYNNGFTVLPVPGNHDYGWNGNHAQEKRFRYLKDAFFGIENVTYPYIRQINGHAFIGLNSMKAEVGFWDGLLADGELGKKQIHDTLGVLKKLENRKPGQKVILYLHHHPFLFPDDNIFERIGKKMTCWLKDGEELMRQVSGRVDILLCGHEHRHLNFSGTELSRRYNIPAIFSSGKSTRSDTKEYRVADDGKAGDEILNTGLLGRMIEINDDGSVTSDTINFL